MISYSIINCINYNKVNVLDIFKVERIRYYFKLVYYIRIIIMIIILVIFF